jgi:hypothetical protein
VPEEGERIDADEFVARVLVQIREPRRHLVRDYGAYSNRVRGQRRKAEGRLEGNGSGEAGEPVLSSPQRTALRRRWANLIRRVCEVDPLVCPRCGAEMRVIGFITEPSLLKRILDHIRKRDRVSRPPPHPRPARPAGPRRWRLWPDVLATARRGACCTGSEDEDAPRDPEGGQHDPEEIEDQLPGENEHGDDPEGEQQRAEGHGPPGGGVVIPRESQEHGRVGQGVHDGQEPHEVAPQPGFITETNVIKRILDHIRKREKVSRLPPHLQPAVAHIA